MGDFNLDLMIDTFYANKLKMEMTYLGMKQYVNQPTRITHSKTIIDLVFSNN